jgi:hypothetical protein
MIEVFRYKNEYSQEWDLLVSRSRIDTFLFYRDFIDYHSHRFDDHSFLIYRKGKLEGALPGNISDSTFFSHQGLTYGGLITTSKMGTSDIIKSFEIINESLKEEEIKEVVYKPLPLIYHKIPSQEDIYALFNLNAEKIGCFISSTIYQSDKIPFTESRKGGIRKAKKEGIEIIESDNFSTFWSIFEMELFQNHGIKPVHNHSEILYLKSKFPDKIKLHLCVKGNEILGGTVIFKMQNLIHVQYISAKEAGKQCGAIDYLFDVLINNIYESTPIFDFGHSNEGMGDYLNQNLIFQKEGFGGRGIVYETFKYDL